MRPILVRKICAFLLLKRLHARQRRRSMYIRDLFRARRTQGETQIWKHLDEDIFYHQKYYRMNAEDREILFQLIGRELQHKRTHLLPITAKQRMVITLRYLATGNSQISLGLSYLVSPSAISKLIPEVLDAICKALQPRHLDAPTQSEWRSIGKEFWLKWNLPNCVGAIDGKHIRIKCPAKSGSMFYNYKKYFSIVLMGVADARYRFSYVDVGAYGAEGDSTIFNKSSLGQALESGSLPIPPPTPFPTRAPNPPGPPVPHVFVADDAFPLKSNIMKPFGGKGLSTEEDLFNYRLSRGRRVVENSFGILASKFRIFHTPIHARPEVVDKIIWTTCCLHNFLIDRQGIDPNLVDREAGGELILGDWRNDIASYSGIVTVSRTGSNNYSKNAKAVRDKFKNFFVSDGQVPWQLKHVNKGKAETVDL